MPLFELLQPSAGGSAGGPARRPQIESAPQAQDVCTLLVQVLLRVQQGQPLSLETVKAAWRELAFSHVFEVGASPQQEPSSLRLRWLWLAAWQL